MYCQESDEKFSEIYQQKWSELKDKEYIPVARVLTAKQGIDRLIDRQTDR